MRATPNALLHALPYCSTCGIRRLGVCARSGEGELAELESVKSYRRFAPGDTIAEAGRPLPHVGTVMTGVATLGRVTARGQRQFVGLLHPGDFVGRPWRNTTPFEIVALTETEMCAFRPGAFESLLSRAPDLQRRMVDMAMDDLDAARQWMTILGRKTAREKVASYFLHMAYRQNVAGTGQPVRIDLLLSREQIADLLSITFETASRQIGALAQDGIVTALSQRQFTVPDLPALVAEAGDDADGGLPA